MKRIVSLIVFIQCCISGWSQTMTIEFKNGATTKYNMKDIKSIYFEEENDNSEDEVSLSIYLDRAGTLSSKISTSQASNLLKLKLSGHMDARDFDFIKWDCMKVEEVDLSDVVIDSYRGMHIPRTLPLHRLLPAPKAHRRPRWIPSEVPSSCPAIR